MTSPRSRLAGTLANLFSLSALLLAVLASLCLPVKVPAAAASAREKLKPTDHYALIFGTVWGPDDHPVHGVTVKIRRARDKKPKWVLTSDHAGEFAQRVPAGKAEYEVWADLKGVKTRSGERLYLAQKVAVHVEYDERVDIGLHLTK